MRLHEASVVVRSLSRSVSTGTLFFFIGLITSPGGASNLVVLSTMVVVGILVGIGYEIAYYKRFRYELTEDTFDVVSGVISRRNREVPLRRIQNVDVRQNVLHRALDIAAVTIETAGGRETEVTLRYVSQTEADRLQRHLRDGHRSREGGDRSREGEERATEDDAELLFEIERSELALLSIFTIDPGASILGGIALSFASGFDPTTIIPVEVLESDLPGTGLIAIGWALLLFVLAAWILSIALTITRYYGFRLTRRNGELHYERGLFQRYSGTIPLEKVQTVTIKEGIPFRWFGYGSLSVETAGYAPGQSGSRGTESAIPLAAYDRVLSLARSVEPFGTVDCDRPPIRARERYAVRYIGILCIILGSGYLLARYTAVVEDWHAFAVLLFAVPVAAHLKWSNRGFQAGDRYFLTRTGFWQRTTKIVPYYRVQAVVYHQTVFQRRRRLASVTADTASTASFFGRQATAFDIDARQGLDLQRTIENRLQERLRNRRRRRSFDRFFHDEYWFESSDETTGEQANTPSDDGVNPGDRELDRDRPDSSSEFDTNDER